MFQLFFILGFWKVRLISTASSLSGPGWKLRLQLRQLLDLLLRPLVSLHPETDVKPEQTPPAQVLASRQRRRGPTEPWVSGGRKQQLYCHFCALRVSSYVVQWDPKSRRVTDCGDKLHHGTIKSAMWGRKYLYRLSVGAALISIMATTVLITFNLKNSAILYHIFVEHDLMFC